MLGANRGARKANLVVGVVECNAAEPHGECHAADNCGCTPEGERLPLTAAGDGRAESPADGSQPRPRVVAFRLSAEQPSVFISRIVLARAILRGTIRYFACRDSLVSDALRFAARRGK